MKITITPEDLEKQKEKQEIAFTNTGQVIDELAYAAGEWTSEELDENNWDYEPRKPYDFDYEADLLDHTKTLKDFLALCKILGIHSPLKEDYKDALQPGAYVALNYPETFQGLLEAYTEKLQEDRTDSISEAYNQELQKEIDAYQKDQYSEWLYGDYRNWDGVVSLISKKFIGNREGNYNEKTDTYTFELDEDALAEFQEHYNDHEKEAQVTEEYIKNKLLNDIYDSADSRRYKDMKEREKQKDERERVAAYQRGRAEEEAEERRQKLLKMKQ